jgi:Tail-tube assembly protein
MANTGIIAPNQLSVQSAAAISGGGRITGNPPAFTLADLSQPGPNPQSIDQLAESTNPLVLQYPADTPPYFFKLDIFKFQRKDWLSVGQADPFAWIVLPLPTSMVDEGGVQYDTESLGALQGNLIGAANDLVQNGLNTYIGSNSISSAATNIATNAAGVAANKAVMASQTQALIAAAGASVNQFAVVLLRGPSYKKRAFSWKLSPETAAESETVRQIIQRLNNCSAPSLKGGQLMPAYRRNPHHH